MLNMTETMVKIKQHQLNNIFDKTRSYIKATVNNFKNYDPLKFN